MSEECAIRKLLVDGDGAGDDRRFAALLPLIIRTLRNPESSQGSLERIMKTLDSAETAIKKQALVATMIENQILSYGSMADEISSEILKSNEKMLAAKNELVTARGIRKNKEKYELLANMIEKIPSRKETNMKLDSINKELEELHEKQRKLEIKLAERRNHLYAFNIILSNFSRFIKEDSDNESGDEKMVEDNGELKT